MNEKAGFFRPEIPADVNLATLMTNLRFLAPLSIESEYFINYDQQTALAVVDTVNGFCKPGCGYLAPPAPDAAIEAMISRINRLAAKLECAGRPIILFRDCHKKGHLERPFPEHCNEDTEEAELVDGLRWLEQAAALTIKKQCFDGWIGAEVPTDYDTTCNQLRQFIVWHKIKVMVIVGICTDICVRYLALSLLNARNAGLISPDFEVVIDVSACTTYDLPLEICRQIGKPETAAHPRELWQHLGLVLMQQSGAILTEDILL